MRQPATSCLRCGQILGAAGEILYTPAGESICDFCSGPGELGLSWGSAELALHLARRRARHRWAVARRRRGLTIAIAATWLLAGAFVTYQVRSSLPPVVTIDSPAPGAPVGRRVVVSGRVLSPSRQGSLWLVARSPRERRWRPRGELVPAGGQARTWQATIEVEGAKAARYRVGVVTADGDASASFKGVNRDESSAWLRDLRTGEQGGWGWGCRARFSGPELPAGARLLESIEVVARADGDDETAFPPCGSQGFGRAR